MRLMSIGLTGIVLACGWVCPKVTANDLGVVNLDSVSPYFYNQGGEFTAFITSGPQFVQNYAPVATVNGGFDTFCIEVDTDFYPGNTYNFSVNLTQDEKGRVLTEGAAYLYYEFAKGNLLGYNYANPSAYDPTFGYADAAELQEAIWWFQDYQQFGVGAAYPAGGGENFYYQLALRNLGLNDATAQTTPNNGLFGVAVFEMFDPGTGQAAQNQLVLIGDHGATLTMLGLGLAGLAGFAPEARRFGRGKPALQP